jgi:hypothetical protein
MVGPHVPVAQRQEVLRVAGVVVGEEYPAEQAGESRIGEMVPQTPLRDGVRSHQELLAGRSFDVFVERIGFEHAGK